MKTYYSTFKTFASVLEIGLLLSALTIGGFSALRNACSGQVPMPSELVLNRFRP